MSDRYLTATLLHDFLCLPNCGIEIRRTDGSWIGVRNVTVDNDTGVHIIDLVDGKFTLCAGSQEIRSREVAKTALIAAARSL